MNTQETIEDLEAKLAPKVSYTPEQHEIARLRFVLDNLFSEVEDVGMHLNAGEIDKATARVEAIRDVVFRYDSMDAAHEIIMKGLSERYRTPSMAEEVETGCHAGDCTAFPYTCTRCHYEAYYGVRTATFGKHEG
jgi:hypothetical protein